MTIYVVVFSSWPERFQTLNSKNVNEKCKMFLHIIAPPPRENDLSQQKFDPKSFQTDGSLIIIIII